MVFSIARGILAGFDVAKPGMCMIPGKLQDESFDSLDTKIKIRLSMRIKGDKYHCVNVRSLFHGCVLISRALGV